MKRKFVKRLMASALIGSMALGLVACSGGDKDKESSDDSGKIVLNVINYHVGTDYAADYYSYLFEEFQKTEAGKNVEFNFEEIPRSNC